MNNRKTYQIVITALTVFAFGLPLAANAAAPSQFENVSVTVSYSDLNIDNADGARVLYARLQRATREACNVESLKVVGSVRRYAQSMDCYRAALETAVQDVDNDAPLFEFTVNPTAQKHWKPSETHQATANFDNHTRHWQ